MLAPAAADLVLELNCLFKILLFSSWKGFVFVSFCFSCSNGSSTTLFGPDRDGPDKAQQFASDCGDDFPLILACHSQCSCCARGNVHLWV